MIEGQRRQSIDWMPLRQACIVSANNLGSILTEERGKDDAHRPAAWITAWIPIAAYHLQRALPRKTGLLGEFTSGRRFNRLPQIDETAR